MKPATIGLLDDDPGMLHALERLLACRGFQVRCFSSPDEFLRSYRSAGLDCVVMDLAMPGSSGLEVQERLRKSGACLPVVFLSGEGDIPASVRAIKGGAVNFLTKPVDATELINTLRLALIEKAKTQALEDETSGLRERFSQLTNRERDVLCHVITGKLNKQIAADLGISEQTVKLHRMRITEKTGLPSVAQLVRAADRLHLDPAG
jgi:FixJ family two-component response regulator